MPVIENKAPFKKNGVLKKDYFDVRGEIFKNVNGEIKKAIKEDGTTWMTSDCPHIVRRLLYAGIEMEDLAEKSGYSVKYLEAILSSSKQATNNVLRKMKEIEEEGNEIRG